MNLFQKKILLSDPRNVPILLILYSKPFLHLREASDFYLSVLIYTTVCGAHTHGYMFVYIPPSNYRGKPLIYLKLYRHHGDNPHIFPLEIVNGWQWGSATRALHSLLFGKFCKVVPEWMLRSVLIIGFFVCSAGWLVDMSPPQVWSLGLYWTIHSQ